MKQIIQNYKTGKSKIEEVPAPILKKGGAIVRPSYSLISAGTERSTLATLAINESINTGKPVILPEINVK